MKKVYVLVLAAAAVAFVGCQREALMGFDAPVSKTIMAGIEAPTRVAFSDEGVFSWKEGDVIGVSYVKAEAPAKIEFTLDENSAGAAKAGFTTNAAAEDLALITASSIGVVPSSALDVANAEAPIKLPASYTWAEGQSNAVMVATSLSFTEVNTFKHVGGIVKVTYKNIPAEANGFLLSADAGICGSFALQDGVIVAGPVANHVKVFFTAGTASEMSFYVPVPTGEYKLTASLIQDGYSIPGTKKETTNPVKIERKTLLLMDAINSENPEAEKITISTAEELKDFLARAEKCGRGSTVTISADIDAGVITPAEAFYGSIDGKDHTITYREEIPEAGSDAYSGLFGYIDGTVKNLKVAGEIKTSGIKNGGIAAECAPNSVFENCESSVNIRMEVVGVSTPKFGGIVAIAGDGTTIKGCTNRGNIGYVIPKTEAGKSTQLGGIVAQVSNHAEIYNCVNYGEVRYEALGTPRIGSMIGYLNDPVNIVIDGCTNYGHMVSDINWASGYVYIGGLTGYVGTNADPALPLERVLYNNCVNYGKVESLGATDHCSRAGGIASYVGMTDAKMNAAGLLDSGQLYEFRNCKNFGEVATSGETTKKEFLGGMVGFGEKVAKVVCTNCVNDAPITAPSAPASSSSAAYVGGIIGGTCGLQSSITDVVIGPNTVITAGSKGVIGLIGGNNAKYVPDMTGKVVAGAKIVKGTAETVAAADTYQKILCKAIAGTTTGVVLADGAVPELVIKNRQTDSLALVAIYNASDGANWAKNKWDLTQPIDKWNGVTLKNNRVSALKLTTSGTITANWSLPAEIGDLTDLTDFRISSNKLAGDLPDALYSLFKLQILYFQNDALTCAISPKIGQLAQLSEFYVDRNANMTGSIPKEIGQLTKLTRINISQTGIGGAIPVELGQCVSLLQFMAFKSALSGELPDIWDLPQLQTVMAHTCPGITGNLPASLGKLKPLAAGTAPSIQLYGCNITGTIPESFATLPAATKQVQVQDNKMSGTIPDVVKAHPNFSSWKVNPQQDGFGLN